MTLLSVAQMIGLHLGSQRTVQIQNVRKLLRKIHFKMVRDDEHLTSLFVPFY